MEGKTSGSAVNKIDRKFAQIFNASQIQAKKLQGRSDLAAKHQGPVRVRQKTNEVVGSRHKAWLIESQRKTQRADWIESCSKTQTAGQNVTITQTPVRISAGKLHIWHDKVEKLHFRHDNTEKLQIQQDSAGEHQIQKNSAQNNLETPKKVVVQHRMGHTALESCRKIFK